MGTPRVQSIDARIETIDHLTMWYSDEVILTQSFVARYKFSRPDP